MKRKNLLTALAALLLFSSASVADAAHEITTLPTKYGDFQLVSFDGQARINEDVNKIVTEQVHYYDKLMAEETFNPDIVIHAGNEIKVLREDDQYIYFSIFFHDYAGGAHGMHWTRFYIYDAKTGQRLTYDKFIGKVSAKELYAGIKQGIVTVESEDGEEKSDAPFMTQENMYVSDNFRLNDDGSISLVYPLYELDCYAFGETYVRLTPEIVKSLKNLKK